MGNDVNMLIEIVRIKTSPEKREEIRSALSSVSGPTESEPGCLSCRVYQDVSDTTTFRAESRWKTQNDLLTHVRSDAYKRLLLLIELSSEPPEIEFLEVSETRGLDLIKAARDQIE